MVDTSVVVPTFNERENVEPFLEAVSSALADERSSFELLVVDDDSPDGTARVARETAAGIEVDSRVIVREGRPDLSRSIVRGLREARGDVVVVMDADLQHPPERILDLADSVSPETPLAIASRYAESGQLEEWSSGRWVVSRGALALSKLLVPPTRGISDPISGFFAVSVDQVSVSDLSANGYKILVELLAEVDPDRVPEVGFVFRNRQNGESCLGVEQFVRFLQHTTRCGLQYRLETFPVTRPDRGTLGSSVSALATSSWGRNDD